MSPSASAPRKACSGARSCATLALQAGELGLWNIDATTGTLACDDRFRELLGFVPGEEATNEACWARVHPDDVPAVQAAITHARDPVSGGDYEAEFRIVVPGRTERWLLSRARVYFDGEGEVRRAARFVGVVIDLTQRKRAEIMAQRQARLLDLSQEAILVWELGGAIVYWNAGAVGLPAIAEEALGQVSHELLRTRHPMGTALFEASLAREGHWVGELVHTARDGRRVVVESRQEVLREPDGRLLVLETNRDIGERLRARGAAAGDPRHGTGGDRGHRRPGHRQVVQPVGRSACSATRRRDGRRATSTC